MIRLVALLPLCLAVSFAASSPKHEVAITIDGLPVVQSGKSACGAGGLQVQTLELLEQLLRQKAPVTGFVIAGSCPDLADPDRRAVLKLWQDAGAELGSQTYSDLDLNTADPAAYEADILKASEALRPFLGGWPLRYFRYPLLHTGATPEVKARIAAFLAAHGYINAPVTFDNADWMFSTVYAGAMAKGDTETMAHVKQDYLPYMESVVEFFEQRAQEVVGGDIPQILPLHANRLNAEMTGDLLAMLKRRGYKFISLKQALKDPAYQLPDNYAGPMGLSWIERWAAAKGVPAKTVPEAPRWLQVEYEKMPKN